MKKKYIGYSLILTSVIIIGFVFYTNTQKINHPFSAYTLLSSSWDKYKTLYINPDGRVVDPKQNQITTSEGQSYAMLRAVFIDDKPEFDKVWGWTNQNLKRPDDNLFGWRWGLVDNGKYGFVDNSGSNSASDADSDIALALILASRRWGQNSYLEAAKKILPDIWKLDTDVVLGKRYLIAGNWAHELNKIIINPSYMAPYAWRIFANVDKSRDWNSMVDPAYQLLLNTGQSALDKNKGTGLPPNWVAMNRNDGSLKATGLDNLNTDYSFDAIRVSWRIALDYQWNKNEEAYRYLSLSYERLNQEWEQQGKIYASYSHDGTALSNKENPAMYATALGYLSITEPELAKKIYQKKIVSLYSNDQNSFDVNLPYYEQNWLWFGSALYNQQLQPFS